ncbi:serine/threonine-protein phosphatase, partial [Frankia sp. Mgl5]|uniref:SpoIIE family protein phosphatase n=1 Tax=Frankia sp. Mgl5 TaxID=2933793 RepID=UPI00200E454A
TIRRPRDLQRHPAHQPTGHRGHCGHCGHLTTQGRQTRSTLALYTDGIVESPTADVSEGTQHLLRVVAETTDLSTTAGQLLTLLDSCDTYDDATVLLARASDARSGTAS